jgi:hypothetical protein
MAETSFHFDSSPEVGQFENHLKKIFTPVDPDPGYVQKLKNKLFKKTEIYLEQNNPSLYLLVGIIGLILVILFYLFVNRFSRK